MTTAAVVFDGRPARVDLFMVAGVPFTGTLTFTDTAGTALDLSGLTLASLVVRSSGGTLATATLDTTNAGTGVIVVTFTAADATNALGVRNARWYLRDATGGVYLDGHVSSTPLGESGVARFTTGGSTTVMAQAFTGAAGAGDLLASNNLSDLDSAATARTNLGLGTAATTAATAYATAAQGATADTAVQPAGLAETSRVFRFNTGGAQTPNDNRYNDWSDLIDALAAAPEGPKSVYIEADFTVPAGAWNLNDTTLHGNGLFPGGGGGIIVTFPTGVTLTGVPTEMAADGIALLSTSTAAVVTVSSADSFYFTNDALIGSTQSAFFDVTATGGAQVLFSFRTGSGLALPNTDGWAGASADYESIDHSGSASCIIAAPYGITNIADNTIRGGSILIALQSASAFRKFDGTSSGLTHTNVSGSITVLGHQQLANLYVGFGTDAKTYVDTEIADAIAGIAATPIADAAFNEANGFEIIGAWENAAAMSVAPGEIYASYHEAPARTWESIMLAFTTASGTGGDVLLQAICAQNSDGKIGAVIWSGSHDANTADSDGSWIDETVALPNRFWHVVYAPDSNTGTPQVYGGQPLTGGPATISANGINRAGSVSNTATTGDTLPDMTGYVFDNTSPSGNRLRIETTTAVPVFGGRA